MKVAKITQTDMVCAENLIKAVAQGKFEFSGIEAMSFVKTCQWFNGIFSEMQKDWQVQQAAKSAGEKEKPAAKVSKPPKKARKKAKKGKK